MNNENPYYYLRIGKASELENPKDRKIYRLLETLPGFLSWATLILLVALSFVKPVWIAIFIIVFDLYWLFRTVYLFLFLRSTHKKMKQNLDADWIKELENLPAKDYSIPISSWREIEHAVFLPFYKEDLEVIKSTFECLSKTSYPKEKINIVLAIEQRACPEAEQKAEIIKNAYSQKFASFMITKHPSDINGELAGKGSNLCWAASQFKKWTDEKKMPYEKILVSAFDIDTQITPGYFARLTHAYLTSKNPTRASYQPIPFYNNNIWEAPAMARVMSYSSTFWHMMQQERPEQQSTFSSHSMSFKALTDVGFWQNNMVSEDSRIFFQCLFRYDGDYRVVSLFYPVSLDANVAPRFWKTMINQYKQQRRWAWGSENIAYIIFASLKNKRMPIGKKLRFIWTEIEGKHSWATNSFIIFLLGWLPIVAGGNEFRTTLLSFSLPRLTGLVMTASMFGIVTSAIMTLILMPSYPGPKSRLNALWVFLQWFLTPLVFIFFSALPALDAQTRLMLGKYMGFWVTEKSRNLDLKKKKAPAN